jgi:leucyl-tRNA synthetase
MIKDDGNLRKGEQNYHDKVFEHEINDLINVTQNRYEA